MSKINSSKYLFILNLQTERGFTIVELLLSLVILAMILLITPIITSNIHHQPQTERFSVQQFFHAATDEIQSNQLSEKDQYRIILTTSTNEQIVLSKYNDTIRRQVNRTGHEVLLRDVKQLAIEYNDQYLLIKLEMKSEQKYEKVITLFSQ
ncbi:MAG TPA: prepilin-type N-terminal cleavage/methylation domain-containing protein [Bacilli bacterium]|nr:prepilin-type N-terminal cleavage/methylation domain-containing protein [Bacilli bacterium]